jgi:hypothetical protein
MTEENKPTEEELENFFIEEGQWIEEQLKAEDYEGCPVCSQMVECLKNLHKHLQVVMEETDSLRDEDAMPTPFMNWFMRYNKKWYLLYKEDMLSLLQTAHLPHKVMKAHPELAISKAKKRKIRSGKNLRKAERAARKKNRR